MKRDLMDLFDEAIHVLDWATDDLIRAGLRNHAWDSQLNGFEEGLEAALAFLQGLRRDDPDALDRFWATVTRISRGASRGASDADGPADPGSTGSRAG